MSATSDYLALDLGAESGRGVLGRFDGDRLSLEEIHRFPNGPVRMLDTLHWDLPRLHEAIQTSIRQAVTVSPGLDGLAIDTWGVDFGLVGRGDTLLGNPVHYRDARTAGMPDSAFSLVPKSRIYEVTGLQFMPFNTAYQLLAMKRAGSPLLDAAESLLLMPDLLGWLLTGRRVAERTNASTTQLYDPTARTWSNELCKGFQLPRAILPELVDAGDELGPIRPSLAGDLGTPPGLRVLLSGTHDTASAVAAVPARSGVGSTPDWCYISSGTWSLMGVETPSPIINEQTYRWNFTNEGGVFGTTRLLKNIMGLWLVQECRRTWQKLGRDYSYDELIAKARNARPFVSLVDPDDASFLTPGDMPARLAAFCEKTGQPVPADEGAFVRCALESLALRYRWAVDRLEEILGGPIRTIHVVGGGSRNALLNQFTADACGRPVHAGPVEATAMGNLLLQAIGRGKLSGLDDLRAVVARSFPIETFEPGDGDAWDEAAARFAAFSPA